MVSRFGGRARRLIITGIVAAGLGAGGTGVALASANSTSAAATTTRTTSTSSSQSSSASPSVSSSCWHPPAGQRIDRDPPLHPYGQWLGNAGQLVGDRLIAAVWRTWA